MRLLPYPYWNLPERPEKNQQIIKSEQPVSQPRFKPTTYRMCLQRHRLSSLLGDISIWGYVKDIVYKTQVRDID
jgi:hypothetical protein